MPTFADFTEEEQNKWFKNKEKMEAFQRLEKIRLSSIVSLDFGQERELAIERKLKKS